MAARTAKKRWTDKQSATDGATELSVKLLINDLYQELFFDYRMAMRKILRHYNGLKSQHFHNIKTNQALSITRKCLIFRSLDDWT